MMFLMSSRFSRLAAAALTLAATLPLLHSTTRANVYATNIKINGGTNDVSLVTGVPVSISYILNEPASLGVKLSVASGANTLRTINFAPGDAGTSNGVNTVSWDGLDDHGNALPQANYALSVTAASSGYTNLNWTLISQDGSDNAVSEAYGIAVNRNPASPYYGRIYVANSLGIPYPAGILKLNADGSPADEGGFSTGGYPWYGDGFSPWRVEVSDDDYVYVSDRDDGLILRWDATLTTNSQTMVLRPDNTNSNALSLTGFTITGSGTNAQLLMADSKAQDNGGILAWKLNASGVCASNDLGTTIVASGGGLSLDVAPFDVAADPQGNLYTCQAIATGIDPSARLLRFPAPGTAGSIPLTNSDWAVGSGDPTYANASGVAIDSSGQFVAVAFTGPTVGLGGTRIFAATNGALVSEIDLGIPINGEVNHTDVDCAWDAVGNVYVIDNYVFRWRVFSPPGTNQATTVALAKIVVGPTEPEITSLQYSNNQVVLTFIGGAGDSTNSFAVAAASVVEGPYTNVAAIISALPSPGMFQAVVLQPSPATRFFRILRLAPAPAPEIISIGVTGGLVTLNFLGQTNDPPTAYTVLSAPAVSGSYSAVADASITAVGPGVYHCTLATNGPTRFYRIQR
jgi:hypothetical protein